MGNTLMAHETNERFYELAIMYTQTQEKRDKVSLNEKIHWIAIIFIQMRAKIVNQNLLKKRNKANIKYIH